MNCYYSGHTSNTYTKYATHTMTTTWILIAHRGGARLFEHTGRSAGLKLLQDIPHPEGRLKNQDINADKLIEGEGQRLCVRSPYLPDKEIYQT